MSELNVKEILELFSQLNIAEMSYKASGVQLELKKYNTTVASTQQVSASSPIATSTPVAVAAPALVTAPVAVETPAIDPKIHLVKSPLVGTFYRAPAPGQPEFVQIGKKVNKGDTLCIVEAMKVMNTIEADASGEVVEILVEAGSVVEFGTALVKIRTV